MIEKAKEIEENSDADSYAYVIESNRQFKRPKFPCLSEARHFNRSKLNHKQKQILDDLFNKVKDVGLNINPSAYNSNYDNCFSFDNVDLNKILHIYREYPISGIIYWNDLYIPTWIFLSFFIEGDVYYVGKSDSSLTNRLRSHHNGETNFFKIHNPSNLVEVWDINYHEYESDFNYNKGLFNPTISRGRV